jgi:hypothetical protein
VSLTIQCILACILACILPCIQACIQACIRHPIRSTSSVDSYLRSNLTADSRTSLVPAMFHFYSLFYYFHSISFHIDVREIYEVQCVLSYGVSLTIHLAIMHQSRRTSPAYIVASFRTQSPTCILGVYPRCVSPVCIQACIQACTRHSSGVHPTCIPFYIFGPILPSVRSYRGF